MKAILVLLSTLVLITTSPMFANSQGDDRKHATSQVSANSFVLPENMTIPTGDEILNNVTFGVLLGTFTYPLSIESDYCKKVRDGLIVTPTNIGFVYSVGAFSNYQQAENYRQELIEMGYENINVISFYKDIPLLAAE